MGEQEKPQCHFLMELLIGGELGALAGIFFAPNSGKQLRSDIKEMGSAVLKGWERDTRASVKETIKAVRHQARE
ncbi:MAG: YtxH domain-containing protein [Syntrophales bacterium]